MTIPAAGAAFLPERLGKRAQIRVLMLASNDYCVAADWLDAGCLLAGDA